MAKIVYFNVSEITRDYYKENPLPVKAETVFIEKSPADLTADELKNVSDADIISVFVHAVDVGARILAQFPQLKLIALRSTGYNNIDLNYCKEHNIEVVNVPGYGDSTVAEFTFGLLIDVTRKISRSFRAVQEAHVATDRYLGFDLKGRTLGIIGTGAIGRYVAKIAKSFDMNILAYDPYPKPEFASEYGFKYVSLDELFSSADVISLHCPLTKDNYHLLDETAFNKMKKGVVIINTARGELIDTEALFKALSAGKVYGAGLDVLEYESALIHDDLYLSALNANESDSLLRSLINLRMLQLKNVIITPHVAFNSIDAVHRILKTANDNIISFLNGKTVNSVLKKSDKPV